MNILPAGFAVFRRFQTLIAVLAVALQAIDAVVGALGHSHSHQPTGCVATPDCGHHHSVCTHHDDHAATKPQQSSQPSDSQPGPHDDCSLCRHFSQPVAPVALILEVIGSERIEPLSPALLNRIVAVADPAHPARGPPLACA
ncbi:MAG TPA: hypothetical protein VKH44_07445 [Pirellulaceae bacterium]|nr:hypothetical protein [Pirellulaceae bacterium]